ncbi:MAG: Co2+/Mg2+ efflux protein ApaG [Gammaproteobacteria bacterium]|nr:Co2+/Mg2+ efflux protein ApaG [Gammaproteobacteria bacterium]
MSTAENYDIQVSVTTDYITEQSIPEEDRYVFAYTITIENHGKIAAKLQTRHWYITNADNNVEEVMGEGVVGEHPHLQPGESYQYTSGAVIETPVGSMYGSYQMLADDGTKFDAPIKPFTLSIPHALN